ncbi:sialic acid TRAP transporter substrate-binding protein SiaP [Paracraurococcus lichenis]|uniref:Sialic acid TRAP transporter substrate-binding protein SiaP n=1 Tax=Paracraurococcus lichenis TaxID=3064888 RepID=A0ABT9E177_9PROT|nr:sialic acid TRAP transporter substrate-binding protein SiaP [Paracraurococcus sp. LOR1-02]MDO9709893.1 sialic acid TRAP transporter substrate-binding protein SiaP [Paracraurococcus sp. LOR1-02]
MREESMTGLPGITRRGALATGGALLAAPAIGNRAAAQGTRLRWAHVYEVNEPYHQEALWAAKEIAARTNGRWAIEVFAASALGNEPQINQGLTLGTVDIIYTGVAFAGASYKPMALSHAPYALRDYAHFQAYKGSDLYRELVAGYDKQTGHHALALTYYGDRHVTANRSVMQPGDMKGLKLRVPQAPSFLMFAKAVGANATPIAFAEVYLALQSGTVDAQENPLPTIQAKKFFEVQSHVSLTGHITDSLLTIVSSGAWRRLSAQEKEVFQAVLAEAAERCGNAIRAQEQELATWFKGQGKTVQAPDRAAFRAACVPLHNDGTGWTKQQYDRLQAL